MLVGAWSCEVLSNCIKRLETHEETQSMRRTGPESRGAYSSGGDKEGVKEELEL